MTTGNVLLGVTGGIAAYKSAEIVRALRKEGYAVRVVMTDSAQQFITPLTLQTLSGHAVHCKLFDSCLNLNTEHISLARWADYILIAPATANCIAKLANGLCDDLLSTVCLASEAPIFIAPAMNHKMWSNPITQSNVTRIKDEGMHIIEPREGTLSCGEKGLGCLTPTEAIIESIRAAKTNNLLKGKHFLVTAGPTQEAIDPVRCITNHSSGKMGYAIAEAAAKAGATVTLISGPTMLVCPSKVKRVDVVSANEMLKAVLESVPLADVFISVAAVADYRPEHTSDQKIKKTADILQLRLVRNPDILATVASLEKRPFLVGFAAETDRNHWQQLAQKKLEIKCLDMIVGNLIGAGSAFGADDNEVTLFTASEKITLGKHSKAVIAKKIITEIAQRMQK